MAEREGLLGQRDTTIADLQAQIAALQETPVVEETTPVVEEPIVEQPVETIEDVLAGEDLGVVAEQPDTPFDQYLRDQEERETRGEQEKKTTTYTCQNVTRGPRGTGTQNVTLF